MRNGSSKPAYGEGKHALIRAAIRFVAREGLTKLTYRSLAAEAGVTVGAVQHHFRSIDDVLESALEISMEETRGYSSEVRSPGDLVDVISQFLYNEPELQAFSVELFVASRHSPSLAAIAERQQEAYRQLNRDLLDNLGVDFDEGLIELIMATVDGIVFEAVISGEDQKRRTELQFDILKQVIANYEPRPAKSGPTSGAPES